MEVVEAVDDLVIGRLEVVYKDDVVELVLDVTDRVVI